MPFALDLGPLHVRVGRDVPPAAPSSLGGAYAADAVKAVQTSSATLLPRPPDASTFAAAPALGTRPDPGTPPPGSPLPDPVRYQFPWNRNALYTPRAGEVNAFQTLRNLADLCWEVFACKETRKEQLQSLDWDIVPRDKKAGDAERAGVATAREFFRKPDGCTPFRSWLGMAIEDVLVIDALSIYRRKTRAGKFYGLELIDGATILPLLDARGRTPAPPQAAYRQIIWGAPMQAADLTAGELYYLPRVGAVNSPYGKSPTEAVILAIEASLSRRMFDLQYYADGNVPEGIGTLPESWTAAQIREFEEYFNSLTTGYTAARSRIKFMPASTGEKFIRFQDRDHNPAFDEFLVKVACACFAVPPSEIGFAQDVNRATAKVQQDIAYRRGVRPLCNFFKDFFDEVLAFDLGLPQLEWTWVGGESEDRLRQATIDEIHVRMGIKSVDEIRARDGDELIGMGNAVFLPTGPIFVRDLIRSVDEDPTTTDPADAAPLDDGGAPAAPVTSKPDAEAAHADSAGAGTAKLAAVQADLRKWRVVALKAVKAGRPVKAFASEAIPLLLRAQIGAELQAAKTAADVLATFGAVEKAVPTVLQRYRLQRRVKRSLAQFFQAQGEALAAHFEDPTP